MDCPKCKSPVSAKAKYCDQCGLNLVESTGFIHQKAIDSYHRGLIDEAVKLWDEALAKEPGSPRAITTRGWPSTTVATCSRR